MQDLDYFSWENAEEENRAESEEADGVAPENLHPPRATLFCFAAWGAHEIPENSEEDLSSLGPPFLRGAGMKRSGEERREAKDFDETDCQKPGVVPLHSLRPLVHA